MAEWLYEDGIGEERAMLIESGKAIEVRIEPQSGIKAGLIAEVQMTKQLVAGKRAIVKLADQSEMLLSPVPSGLTEGAWLIVEVTRAAIDEKTRFKLPLCKAVPDKLPIPAPTLRERIDSGDIPVRLCHAHEPDYFAQSGWHEVVEEARSGTVYFAQGTLLIAITPAMTLIDIDGDAPPLALSLGAANAAAQAIRRLDLQGSIGIDFPNLRDKADRQAVANAFDDAMSGPFERTALNGFGFLQLIRRRTGPSVPEIMQKQPMRGFALELLRLGERAGGSGKMTLVAHPAIIGNLEGKLVWMEQLSKRTGRAVSLRADPKLAIGAGYVE